MRVESTASEPVIVAEFDLPDGSVVTLGESAEMIEAAKLTQKTGKRRHIKKGRMTQQNAE